MADTPGTPETTPTPVARAPRATGGKKTKTLVPIDESTTLESQSLDEEAQRVLTPENFSTLKTIAKAVGKDGLSLEEACVIANVEFENFKRLAEQFPIIIKIVKVKETEYKHMLLRALATKARSGDDKMAQWLLERKYPEEYGGGKRGPGGESEADLLGMAISFVQESQDSQPIVRKQIEIRAVRRAGATSEVKKLQSFLS